VDVREDHEWVEGRLPGAVHVGRGILERDIEKQISDYAAKVVLYCGGGYRSALAADNLQKMGYSQVFSLAGGIRAWRDQSLPEDK
jgi:rhodanese-related sulfurtransferase